MTTPTSPLLFDLTRQIVEEVERRVLNFKSNGPIADTVSRNGFFPAPFLKLGISELMRPMVKWAAFTAALLIAAMIFVSRSEITPEAKSSIFMLCTFIPLFLVVFAVPSTFSFDTISGPQIRSLADHICSLGFDTEAKLDSLAECVSLVAERTYARTKMFQNAIAVIWGLFLYGFNQVTNLALKLVQDESIKMLVENIPAIALYVVVSVFSLVAILGYKRANDAVFRRLSFSIEELKYRAALLS